MIDFRKISNPKIDIFSSLDFQFFSIEKGILERLNAYKSPNNQTAFNIDFRNINKNSLGVFLSKYTYFIANYADENRRLVGFDIYLNRYSTTYIKQILLDGDLDLNTKILGLILQISKITGYKTQSIIFNLNYPDHFFFIFLNEKKQNSNAAIFALYKVSQTNPFYNLRYLNRYYEFSLDYNTATKKYAQYHSLNFSIEYPNAESRLQILDNPNPSLADEANALNIIRANFSVNNPLKLYRNTAITLHLNGYEFIILLAPIPSNIEIYNKIVDVLTTAKLVFPPTIFNFQAGSYIIGCSIENLLSYFDIKSANTSSPENGKIFYFQNNQVKNKIFEQETSQSDTDTNRNWIYQNTILDIEPNIRNKILHVINPITCEEEYYPIGYDITAIATFGNNYDFYTLLGFDETTSEPVQLIISKEYEISNIRYRDYRIQRGGVVPINNNDLFFRKNYSYTVDQSLTVINPPNSIIFDIIELHKYVYNLSYNKQDFLINPQNFSRPLTFYNEYGEDITYSNYNNFVYAYRLKLSPLKSIIFFFNKITPVSGGNYDFLVFPKSIIIHMFNNLNTNTKTLNFFSALFDNTTASIENSSDSSYKTIFGNILFYQINKTDLVFFQLNQDNVKASKALNTIAEKFVINFFIDIYFSFYVLNILDLFKHINQSNKTYSYDKIRNIVNFSGGGSDIFQNILFYKALNFLKTSDKFRIYSKYETTINVGPNTQVPLYIDDYLVDSSIDATISYSEFLDKTAIDNTTVIAYLVDYPTNGIIILSDVFYIKPALIQNFYINKKDAPFSTLNNAIIYHLIFLDKMLVYLIKTGPKLFKLKSYEFITIPDQKIADANIKNIKNTIRHTRFFSTRPAFELPYYPIYLTTEEEFLNRLNASIISAQRYIYNILPTFKGKILYTPFGLYNKDYVLTDALNKVCLYSS